MYDGHFSNRVSPAMYLYYHTWHLYRVLFSNARSDSWYLFDSFLHQQPMIIAKDLDAYFKGIGNVNGATGDLHERDELKLHKQLAQEPLILGAAGHYGKVTTENHLAYETQIAPFVPLYRILKDLLYTRNPAIGRDWDLPEELKPDPIDGSDFVVTANLLGWRPATKLTEQQRESIEYAGITESSLNVKNNFGFPLNLNLIYTVHRAMSAIRYVDAGTGLKITFNGSKSQIGFSESDPTDMAFDRNKILSERSMTTSLCKRLPDSVVHGASHFRYRQKRRTPDTVENVVSTCYILRTPRNVPAAEAGVQAVQEEPGVQAPEPVITCPPNWNENSDAVYEACPTLWNVKTWKVFCPNGKILAYNVAEDLLVANNDERWYSDSDERWYSDSD